MQVAPPLEIGGTIEGDHGEPQVRVDWAPCIISQGGRPMMKVTFVLAAVAVVLTTSPPATPAKAQDLKMAQGVDVQIGRDRYDRYDRDRDHRVGVGPGGVSIGPRQRCRMDRVFL